MRTPYELQLESRADQGPELFTFQSADGVVSKAEFRTAELLLANAVDPAPDDRVLVVDANYGVLPVTLGTLAASVTATETSARAAALCERNARENGVDVDVELLAEVGELGGRFEMAAYAPRPYDPTEVVKQRIADAVGRLEPGGELYLAADRDEGAKRYRRTLSELAGDADRVSKSDGKRVFRVTRPAEYDPPRFVEDRTISAAVAGRDLKFVTRPGLFSPGSLDRGTSLLAETVHAEADLGSGNHVLDVACGYGPLGISLGIEVGCDVWLSDDSAVAARCARRSADRNGLEPGAVVAANCLDGVDGRFDAVVANPPTHAGEGVTTELFDGVKRHLAAGGEFWLVYNETLGYETDLTDLFDAAEVLRREDGYAIAAATNSVQ